MKDGEKLCYADQKEWATQLIPAKGIISHSAIARFRRAIKYIFLHGCLVLLNKLVHLSGEAAPLAVQLLVQFKPVLIHLCLQLIL